MKSGKVLQDNIYEQRPGQTTEKELQIEEAVCQQQKEDKANKNKQSDQVKKPPPFLERLAKTKKEKEEKEIHECLLDAIKQISCYAKF